MIDTPPVRAVSSSHATLIARIADRYCVDPTKLLATLKATAFRGDVSNEQMMSLLIVADQYQLNPFTRELYAFPDKGGIVPVVGIDGWLRLINSHPAFDGLAFTEADVENGAVPAWIECAIHRTDRSHPVRVREYLVECKRGTQPWSSHPRRMLRHKALAQCARIAFGFVGIYDADEAERIISGGRTLTSDSTTERLNVRIAERSLSEQRRLAVQTAPEPAQNGAGGPEEAMRVYGWPDDALAPPEASNAAEPIREAP